MTARDAWGQVAHTLRVLADDIDKAIEPGARAPVPASLPAGAAVAEAGAPPPASAPSLGVDTGKCPKHGVPWEPGTYGSYCKQMTDDAAWGKEKPSRDGGTILWCKLTPKNAPDWVKAHGLPA